MSTDARNDSSRRRRDARAARREDRRERRRERRQRRALRRRLAWPAVLIVVVGAGLLLFTDVFGFQLIPGLPMVNLVERRQFATSTITLESVQSIARFDTVRYVHRAVFPYDYLPDGVSLNVILQKLRASTTTVRETLTPDEYLYFQTYNLASDIGLPLSGGTYDFVVVTLVISAGVRLANLEDPITIEETTGAAGEPVRTATVTIESPQVTDVSVEDINPDEYPYPDTALGADGWRRVAEYVRSQPLGEEITRELLTAADENARTFIGSVLRNAGFDDVRFVVDLDNA